MKRTIFNTAKLLTTDSQLGGLPQQWRKLASQESINRFVAAAEKKGFKAIVVDNKAAALQAIINAVPDKASISTTGSISLDEVGFADYAIANPNKWNNLKGKLLSEKDPGKKAEILGQINICDYLITTPAAVTESAEIVTADLTNTRVAPTLGAKKLVVLVGGQKLVPDLETGRKRLFDYVVPLESARVREVFKLPGTYPNFQAQLVGPDPMGAPGRITFIYVKEELGF